MLDNEKLIDPLDVASREADREVARAESNIRLAVSQIPAGSPGECIECGEEFSRLVQGHCGRCRDLLGRP